MSSQARILAVDDNPTNLAIVEEALDGLYEVRLARDGEEALRIAPQFQPDVVLLDVMMPRVDGCEVCRRMKHDPSLTGVRIVMVSAKVKPDDRQEGYRAGADDYLTKPFCEDELVAKIRVVLDAKRSDRLASVQQGVQELCDTAAEVLAMMSSLRGAETSAHLVSVRTVCQFVAGELRLTEHGADIDDQFLDNLYHASVLHDIGMIALPDSLIQKRRNLTAEESEAFQQHTLIGERLLHRLAVQKQGNVSFFRLAANVARWHHENWDGSGYPDGRRKSNIPLAARIVRVADAFDDAMTAQRPYNQHATPAGVLKAIGERSGAAFDPEIVAACYGVLDEIAEHYTNGAPDDSFELVTAR